jgi:hypothetical protein
VRLLTNIHRRFLCACLRSDSAHARQLTQTPGWDWEHLLKTATEEAVLPTLAAVAENGLDISAPPEIAAFLNELLRLHRERNEFLFGELRHAAGLLNEIGIEPVLLKGLAYLSAGVYSDPGARYLLDLDLLVPEEQLSSAVRQLMDSGYQQDETDRFVRFRHHHAPLHRGSVMLEIHHRLGLGPGASILPAKAVLESATAAEMDGVRVRIPSPTHLMTHLIIHSQMLHPYNERIWPPVRAMYDLVELQRRFSGSIEWPEIERRFRTAGQYGILVLHLMDVGEAFGLQPPIDLRMSLVTRIRRYRRRALRQFPGLRYFDPLYMFSAVCIRRLRVLRNVLVAPGGLRFLIAEARAPGVYQRFFTDVIAGRGR